MKRSFLVEKYSSNLARREFRRNTRKTNSNPTRSKMRQASVKHNIAFLVIHSPCITLQNITQHQNLLGLKIYTDSSPKTAPNAALCDMRNFVSIFGNDGVFTVDNLVRRQVEEDGYPFTELLNIRLQFCRL